MSDISPTTNLKTETTNIETVIRETDTKLKYVADWKEHFPDLQHIMLAGTNFSGMKLAGCNFSYAVLSGSNFEGADLERAVFTHCILTDANFSKANLKHADFTGAHLVRANFLESCMVHCNFTDANMESVSYPFNCNGFQGVRHSMNNVQNFLTLFKLLKGVDPELMKAIAPWFNEQLDLPDEVRKNQQIQTP